MLLKYGIIGTGAIGGYYGGKLANGGKDVHFLFHSDYEYVKSHGLQVDSCDGSFHLENVNAYNDTKSMPKCDVVFVCLKTTRNGMLQQMLPSILHKNTVVVMIQNGIGVEADLQKAVPNIHIAAGLAFICTGKVGPGHIDHQYYGKLTIAPYNFDDEELVKNIISDLNGAGVEAVTAEYNIARWKKAVWNIPFNGMTVVMNTQTDTLLQNPATEKLIYDLMIETIRAANHVNSGNPIGERFADVMIQSTKAMIPYSPSMKLDFDNHRQMEINYIYSRSIEEAAKAGFKMSKVEMLEAELKFIEAGYLKNAAK